MSRSPLFGRRIHIAGAIDKDAGLATAEAVDSARRLLQQLVPLLMSKGATFVLPVDAEPTRAADGKPICFDWLVWEAIASNLTRRPGSAHNPLAVAIQHHKSENQVPPQFQTLWDSLRNSDLVAIRNASFWNMGAKRMEVAAEWGDILLTIGGSDGVLFLANLYHGAGKPVIPLPDPLCAADNGSRKLFAMGQHPASAANFFRTGEHSGLPPDGWLNRLHSPRATPEQRAATLIDLLESLKKPTAFAVRLLNPKLPDYKVVDDFFTGVVKPVIEDELGYCLEVVDGKQHVEHPHIDQEIFAKLARARLVVADLTGERPNCFLETGIALGRQVSTIITCMDGGKTHFDLSTVSTHFWKKTGTLDARRREFREHVESVRDRPAIVPADPLIA
jgi:hypothetical protein